MKYLFIVDYSDDAERKRIDYLLEKWQDQAIISKPRGLIFIIETRDINKFAEELFSKLSPQSSKKVRAFVIQEENLQSKIPPKEKVLEYYSKESENVVKRLLRYIFSKNNLYYYSSDNYSEEYFTLTRKGRVSIEVSVKPISGGTKVKLRLSGYGEAVEYVAEKIDNDIRLLLEG
ncbi:hypothetical protein PFDSM3638_03260 [Pyrococcus furiosus DSM 3638]|uniref:Uncharacterized protein n=3 Tax=Pyrococcus furiosus TaxID=2261 RepID=A0A5C0XR73_PYRFU|nr:hypothetical protein [Pyrococcus furiosus]AAL80777.1 hypothetical protein PF0653 [Pyrococcus furiosus DSM 3638]AFN03443.1 hypothetical protein PFC_02405 [Pyrococcus furiosus COM1]QEK78354.1 hypothetical protein PFDSM3638_03260 [Pyrococcus furiosus DSM 3638]